MASSILGDMGAAARSVLASIGVGVSHLVDSGEIQNGSLQEMQLGEGGEVLVKVLAIDMISRPRRARVERTDTGEVLTVPVLEEERGGPRGSECAMLDSRTTTIFQDYEDSFNLLQDYWSPKEMLAEAEAPECDGQPPPESPVRRSPKAIAWEYWSPKGSPAKEAEDGALPESPQRRGLLGFPSFEGGLPWQKLGLSSPSSPPAEDKPAKEARPSPQRRALRALSLESGLDWEALGISGSPPRAEESAAGVEVAESGGSAWEKLKIVDSFVSKVAMAITTGGAGTWLTGGASGFGGKPGVGRESARRRRASSHTSTRGPGARPRRASVGAKPGEHRQGRVGDRCRGRPPADEPARCETQVPRAKATVPMELCFDVPEDLEEGQQSLCVQGPHGPLQIPVPEGARAGDRVRARIGPSSAYQAAVPEGAAEGDLITLELPGASKIQVPVPVGKRPGDKFEISPPCLMVQVPEGAGAACTVAFTTPEGEERMAQVPDGVLPGQYFEVPLEVDGSAGGGPDEGAAGTIAAATTAPEAQQ